MPHCKPRAAALLALLAALALMPALAGAQAPELRGYARPGGYQYVYFGSYPYDQEGTVAPVLWRVLGPGTPEAEDVTHAEDASEENLRKYVRGDDLTGENADVFCLMTEYIIDVALYAPERDVRDGPTLSYENSAMRQTVNTEIVNRLLTPQEQAILVEMPNRGLVSLPSRRGELHRGDYGFITADFDTCPHRVTTGTPYAFKQGLKHVEGVAWYYTTDWRRVGYRWIVANDGHISVAGSNRVGGVRLVCYVHRDRLQCLGGDGTKDSPFVLSVASPEPKQAQSEPQPSSSP